MSEQHLQNEVKSVEVVRQTEKLRQFYFGPQLYAQVEKYLQLPSGALLDAQLENLSLAEKLQADTKEIGFFEARKNYRDSQNKLAESLQEKSSLLKTQKKVLVDSSRITFSDPNSEESKEEITLTPYAVECTNHHGTIDWTQDHLEPGNWSLMLNLEPNVISELPAGSIVINNSAGEEVPHTFSSSYIAIRRGDAGTTKANLALEHLTAKKLGVQAMYTPEGNLSWLFFHWREKDKAVKLKCIVEGDTVQVVRSGNDNHDELSIPTFVVDTASNTLTVTREEGEQRVPLTLDLSSWPTAITKLIEQEYPTIVDQQSNSSNNLQLLT